MSTEPNFILLIISAIPTFAAMIIINEYRIKKVKEKSYQKGYEHSAHDLISNMRRVSLYIKDSPLFIFSKIAEEKGFVSIENYNSALPKPIVTDSSDASKTYISH